MTIFVPIMMFGWIPFTIFLFGLLKPRKAAVVSLILGFLFLPVASYDLLGIPSYTKTTAIFLPIIFAIMLFDAQRLKKLSLHKLDIPIIIWCCCPFASSIANGLGIYNGISETFSILLAWGLPYAIGKIYFCDQPSLKTLAVWIVIGGLIYIPFCLWEMRMSPNLHNNFYGFRPDWFGTSHRFGGYRPVVFLQHGLAVGIWMMSALLMGIWLWRSKTIKILCGIPIELQVMLLFPVFLFCRSLNSIILFIGGLFVYFTIQSLEKKSIVLCLAFIPICYIGAINSGVLSTKLLINYANRIDNDRANSLQTRLDNEKELLEKAWQRPIFGWGGFGRNRIYNESGQDTSLTDGFWIIVFGINGLVGLISIGCVLLLPTIVFWRKYRLANWKDPKLIPIIGFICIIPLYVIDCLMNAMINPVYTVAAGGILEWIANNDKI